MAMDIITKEKEKISLDEKKVDIGSSIYDGKLLKLGYTTGSSATGAAKAAADLLLNGKYNEVISIDTPAKVRLHLNVLDQRIEEEIIDGVKKKVAYSAVIKDGGDDPDVTTGLLIYAKAEISDSFIIDGGIGVGRHVETTFLGNKGEAAINKVPRQMIEKEVREITKDTGKEVKITVFVPKGEETAKNTMNRTIGVENGISIIGTSGIVKPMSDEAIIKTFCLEIDLYNEKYGNEEIYITLGNYGNDYLKKKGLDVHPIQVSNFIGDAFKYLNANEFKNVHLYGHIGKLSKLAAGSFNTHSSVNDSRMIAFIYFLALHGASLDILEDVNSSLTAQDAYKKCVKYGYNDILNIMEKACEKNLKRFLKKTEMNIDVNIYLME